MYKKLQIKKAHPSVGNLWLKCTMGISALSWLPLCEPCRRLPGTFLRSGDLLPLRCVNAALLDSGEGAGDAILWFSVKTKTSLSFAICCSLFTTLKSQPTAALKVVHLSGVSVVVHRCRTPGVSGVLQATGKQELIGSQSVCLLSSRSCSTDYSIRLAHVLGMCAATLFHTIT